jgi:hypothetical protein
MMDSTFIKAIRETADPLVQLIDNSWYSTATLKEVVQAPLPLPASLKVSSLTALLDYLLANRDGIALDKAIVVVASPDSVYLASELFGFHQQRKEYIRARPVEITQFGFGQYIGQVAFQIALRTQFAPSPDVDLLGSLLARITNEELSTHEDDGISQVVNARAGVVLVEKLTVPKYFFLRPYRTFSDIEQPGSHFLLRLKRDKEQDRPLIALFEVDGGLWRKAATDSIKQFLHKSVVMKLGIPILA